MNDKAYSREIAEAEFMANYEIVKAIQFLNDMRRTVRNLSNRIEASYHVTQETIELLEVLMEAETWVFEDEMAYCCDMTINKARALLEPFVKTRVIVIDNGRHGSDLMHLGRIKCRMRVGNTPSKQTNKIFHKQGRN